MRSVCWATWATELLIPDTVSRSCWIELRVTSATPSLAGKLISGIGITCRLRHMAGDLADGRRHLAHGGGHLGGFYLLALDLRAGLLGERAPERRFMRNVQSSVFDAGNDGVQVRPQA